MSKTLHGGFIEQDVERVEIDPKWLFAQGNGLGELFSGGFENEVSFAGCGGDGDGYRI